MIRWTYLLLTALAVMFAWDGSARAEEKVGIVVLHGKGGSPAHLAPLVQELRAVGYLAVAPEMPWSRERAYDRSLTEAHAEIESAFARLGEQGATRFAIAGHSMGANAAMGYAATHPDMAAVVALAPGQLVESDNFRTFLGQDVARAKAMTAEGRGDVVDTFADRHLGATVTATTKARVYASYFDPDGLANIPQTIPRIRVPLLWVVGTRDRLLMERGAAYAFDRLPSNPRHSYVEVSADHMATPDVARETVLDWLRTVFPQAGKRA